MKTISLKHRAIFITLSVISVFSALLIYYAAKHRTEMLQLEVRNQIDEANIKIDHLLKNNERLFRQKAQYFLSSQEVVDAVAKLENEKLFEITLPYFTILKAEDPYFYMINFYDNKGNLILNMNEPWMRKENAGETNQLLSLAVNSEKTQEGYEVHSDGLYYKLIRPIKKGSKTQGYIELGLRDKEVIKRLNQQLDASIYPYFSTGRILNESKTQENQGLIIDQKHYRIENNVDFFNQLNLLDANMVSGIQKKIGNDIYYIKLIDKHESLRASTPDGVIIAFDITPIVRSNRGYLTRSIIFSVLILSIIFLILNYSFTHLIRKIKQLYQEVDVKVDKKTKKFVDLNTELNLIFNNTADGILLIDKEKTIQKVNETYCKITGFKRNEIVGKKCYEFFPCHECHTNKCVLERLKNGEEKIERDIEAMPKKEGSFHCIQTVVPIIGSNGEFQGILENFKDITQRKKVEQALIESEQQFSKFLNYLPLAVFIKDENSKIINVNKYVKENLLNDSQIDRAPHEVFDSELADRILVEDQHVLEHDYLVLEEELPDKFGNKLTFLTHKFKMKGPNNTTQIGGISLDITKRKHAEEQLRILSRAIRQSPVSILITNADGFIEFVNPSFCETTGYTYGEIISKNPRILKSGYQDSEFYRTMWSTLKNGHEWKGEVLNRKKSGELYWENNFISPIKNSKGTITHFLAIKEDITKRKKGEAELLMAKEKAEESDRLKTAFLANMSHEIRTPLNAIVGFSTILCDPDLQLDEKESINQHILENSGVLLKLIEDIIDISKIESEQLSINKTVCVVDRLMSEIYATFDKKINHSKGKNVNFFMKQNQEQDFAVLTDPHRLRQVVSNLIENAFKFTNEGFIEFGFTVKDDRQLLFYVIDTGIGIRKEMQESIFDRFRQVDDSQTRTYGGTGLGLAITKNLVELLDGKIWLQSSPGIGTTFFFTIDYQKVEMPDVISRNQVEKSDFNWNNKRILIAEDVDANFRFLKAALRNTNAEIIWARDGREAVELYSKHKNIDVILMDINMPNMNGYEATKEIKKMNDKVPIIGQTAYAMVGEKEKCLNSGFDHYIAKPILVNNLLNTIDEYLFMN